MKLRNLFTLCLAGLSMSLFAQTHAEGVEYYKADQINNAETLLKRNYNNPGTDKAVANYYLGQIALIDKNKDEARKYFEQGIQINPEYAYNYIGMGQLALAAGNADEAKTMFKKAESLGKKDSGVHVGIARAYYEQDPVAYAKDIEDRIKKARKINYNSVELNIFEGDRLADKKEWGPAGAKYEAAKNADANATEAYVKYANLFKQVNPTESIRLLKELLSVNPNSALGQRELANSYYNNNDYKNAALEYGKYVKNPNHFKEDEDRYAFLLFYDGKYQQGYDYATSLLATNPDNFTARRFQLMNGAQEGVNAGDLQAMAEKLYSAHKANPSANRFAPIDYIIISDEFAKAGRIDDAVAVLNEAIAENPDNANFNKSLAQLWLNAEQYDKAADAYEGYVAKIKEPGYADLLQLALYSYFGALKVNGENPESAVKYLDIAEKNANAASQKAPEMYRPYKVLGDIAIVRVANDKAAAASAALPMYQKALSLLEAKPEDLKKYANDAKVIYNYLGNHELDQKNVAKAKEYFNKYLELDPENADYRKFVEGLK